MLQIRLNDLVVAIRTKINSMVPRLLPAGGLIGQVLSKTGATDYAVTWADDSTGWTVLRLTTDFTVSATAAADVAGLAFAPLASKDYEIEGKFLLQSTVVTTGPRIGVTLPTGLLDQGYVIREAFSNIGDSIFNATATGINPNGGAPTINQSYLSTVLALIRVGSAPTGTFKIQFASEIAASAVTMKAGSFIRYRALT